MSPTEKGGCLQKGGITKDTFATPNLNFGSVILHVADAVGMPSVNTSSSNNRTKD